MEYYCDLCKKRIDVESEIRYVVSMEVVAAMLTPEGDDGDERRDLIAELERIVARLDQDDIHLVERELHQEMRFDLCEDCRLLFLSNPLGRHRRKSATGAARFSSN